MDPREFFYILFIIFSGDARVNTVPSLTSSHEMGRRRHNMIVNRIRNNFPDQFPDNDTGNEELFQVLVQSTFDISKPKFIQKLPIYKLEKSMGMCPSS